MFSVNNISVSNRNCNFKSCEVKNVVKIGKNIIDADEYVKIIDRDTFINAVKRNDLFNYYKTCNFAKVQAAAAYLQYEQDLYSKLIQRCCDDIDKAIKSKAPENVVDKLTGILELFIKKFGYLEK